MKVNASFFLTASLVGDFSWGVRLTQHHKNIISGKLRQHHKYSMVDLLHGSECSDERDERIHPLVKAAAFFFPENGFDITPYALTSLSAFRFGGAAMRFHAKKHTFDDDIDFLLMPRSAALLQNLELHFNAAAATIRKFSFYLSSQLQLRSKIEIKRDPIFFFRRNMSEKDIFNEFLKPFPDASTALMHILLYIDVKSEVTDTDEKTTSQRFIEHYKGPDLYNQLLISQNFSNDAIPRLTVNFTCLDFWVDLSGQFLKTRVKNVKFRPLLFAGVEFYSPWEDQDFNRMWLQVQCSEWGKKFTDLVDKTSNICNLPMQSCTFAFPAYSGYDQYLLSNVFDGVHVNDTFKSCAQKLDVAGYRSFASCHVSPTRQPV